MTKQLFFAFLFLIALDCGLSPAQDFAGGLIGSVSDSSGGRLPSAVIEIRATSSAFVRKTVSDARGEFRFDNLAPGIYGVTANAKGFGGANTNVNIVVSSVREIAVRMTPAVLSQSAAVRGQASSITTQRADATSTVRGGAVTAKDLETLPLAQRSFANIAFLVPGTEPLEPSDPTKARITAVSVGGSSGLNNALSVDGGDNSDDYIGGFLQNFSPDAIEEFAFHTSQEDADTGGTVGGAVVITTRRGTNDWHGGGSFYERAAALNARYPIENPAPGPKQPFSRQNYTATLGGPVVKDKLWFFSSFEFVHENASIAYSPASLTEFQALASLAAGGLIPGVKTIPVSQNVPIPFRDYLGTIRVDWSQSPRSQWFLRAALDNYTTHNALVQQATLPSTGATSRNNYLNAVLGNQFLFSPSWLGSFTFSGSGLHLTQARNSSLGFALAFPFSSTSRTISGFETFGDNQFITAITAFPVLRNQEKYQVRYAITHSSGRHAFKAGVDFIHEPVLSGALAATAEDVTVFAMDPTDYLNNRGQFAVDLTCTPTAALQVTPGTECTSAPAGNGSFSQNVQRLGVYTEDSWRVTSHLTLNYGLRYDTTFGLFTASGRSQAANPALLTLQALHIPLFAHPGAPRDYRKALAPRLGLTFAPGESGNTVLRAGFGLYYNDLAQNGWVSAFQAVNEPAGVCVKPGDAGCLAGAADGGAGAIIDPAYKTPYAIHASGGIEHAFNTNWTFSADWIHESGVHGYRRYEFVAGESISSPLFASDADTQQRNVPDVSVFRSDNRSRYDALALHVQGNTAKFNLVFNYTLSRAKTWGCVLGELFDYVNGVCDPLNAFAKGDYGPSGEDIPHRGVLAGTYHAPLGIDVSIMSQAESARPFTLTTPDGDRAVVNGVKTSLDEFRGKAFLQTDLRISRPFTIGEHVKATPFAEFFNLFNRNNPGANYVTNVAALPVDNPANVTALCLDTACTRTQRITSLDQLRTPAGALGDFFGPGTTVGIPFAAQLGIRLSF